MMSEDWFTVADSMPIYFFFFFYMGLNEVGGVVGANGCLTGQDPRGPTGGHGRRVEVDHDEGNMNTEVSYFYQ
jgi:hypothetical protein